MKKKDNRIKKCELNMKDYFGVIVLIVFDIVIQICKVSGDLF